jgi:hypothetical protein
MSNLKKLDEKLSRLEAWTQELVQIVENISGDSYRDFEADQKRNEFKIIRGGEGA